MSRRAMPVAALAAALAAPVAARAQEAPAGVDALGDLPASSFWEGGGVRVSEGMIFHPTFELSTAYESNVFYQDSSDGPDGPVAAGVARLTAGGQLGTVTPGRMQIEAPGRASTQRLAFLVVGQLTWNQYLSSATDVTSKSDLGIGLHGNVDVNPNGRLTLGVADAYVRNVNPGQSLREDLDRDRNEARATLTWKPGGGALETYLGYTFVVDIFESSALLFEDRLSHLATVGARWRWLPRTQISLEAGLGRVSPSDRALKSASTPLRVWAGIATLITPRLGVIARAGYGNGFYAGGANVSTVLATIEGRYAIGPTLRTALGYSHDFDDALVGNFYTDHRIYARAGWQLLDRWQLRLSGELRVRGYGGIHDAGAVELCGDAACGKFRNDLLARVDAQVEVQVRPWLFAAVAYDFQADRTDFFVRSATATDSGAYSANEAMLKVAARF